MSLKSLAFHGNNLATICRPTALLLPSKSAITESKLSVRPESSHDIQFHLLKSTKLCEDEVGAETRNIYRPTKS